MIGLVGVSRFSVVNGRPHFSHHLMQGDHFARLVRDTVKISARHDMTIRNVLGEVLT